MTRVGVGHSNTNALLELFRWLKNNQPEVVLITASRTWRGDSEEVIMQRALEMTPANALLRHGAALGGDTMAAKLWTQLGRTEVEANPVDPSAWKAHRGAGFARNDAMVAKTLTARDPLCLAFIHNHSHGASHAAKAAEEAGIKTFRFTIED